MASSRVHMPMAYYARQADLIAIIDITKPVAPDYTFKLKVREVLRGPAQVGDLIVIPSSRLVSSFILPYANTSAAVLLKKDKNGQWEAIEAYGQPAQIDALREVIQIVALPTERQQLLAFQTVTKAAPDLPKSMLQQELASAVGEMREPDNFDLIESSLPLVNENLRADLLKLLGTISDPRGVSVLLAAIQAPEPKVKVTAAQTVSHYFPGAPGVDEAMRRVLQDASLKRTAQDYLSKRDPSVIVELTPTPYLEAQKLFQSDQKVEGALAYLRLMENKKPEEYFSSWTANDILPYLDAEGKIRLRHVLMKHVPSTKSYLQAEDIIKLMRRLPHEESIPALTQLLNDPDKNAQMYFSWEKASMQAAFALRDLGPRARAAGTAKLMECIGQCFKTGQKPRSGEPEVLFLQLAWLADDKTWLTIPDLIDPQWQTPWTDQATLREKIAQDDEGRGLVELLKNPPQQFSEQMRRWVIYRLGDLKDTPATDVLFSELEQKSYIYPQAAKDALIQRGGEDVETAAVRLLRHDNMEIRRQAMDILRALRGPALRLLLRYILVEPNLGDKDHAIFMLGYIGTPDDLPLLIPLADFWKNDRTLQQRAVDAIAAIRNRGNYDINGPIQKVGGFKATLSAPFAHEGA